MKTIWHSSNNLQGMCQRVCLILLSCVLSYCAPTFSSDIEFCGLCHTYDEPTLTAFRCFLFWTSIGNNSRAECLSWSVIFDVIPYKCQQLFPQTGSGFICYLLYLPVPLNFMCVRPHCTSWLTCCVYYDSRPDSPHITISPSGWHRRQADNEKEGGYITAFLTNDWHKVPENYHSSLQKFTDVLLF